MRPMGRLWFAMLTVGLCTGCPAPGDDTANVDDTANADSGLQETGDTADIGRWVTISADGADTCGLTASGRIYCAGIGADLHPPPTQAGFVELDVGSGAACAVGPTGMATCWGAQATVVADVPTEAVHGISVGSRMACALREADSTPVCWGERAADRPAPVLTAALVETSDTVSCTLGLDGYAECAGITVYNEEFAPVGAPPWSTQPEPGAVFESLSAGNDAACGLANGAVSCWGAWHQGDDPLHLGAPTTPQAYLAMGSRWACTLTGDGTLTCWGVLPGGADRPPPTATRFRTVSVAFNHACGLTIDGRIECWGRDSDGAFGLENVVP